METKNQTLKEKLRLWLLNNPEANPYRFSFDKLFRVLTNSQRLLPDFIIIGSTKSGTWTLTDFLMQHPNIFMERNLHFFEYNQSDQISWYRKFFPTESYKSKIEKKTKQKFIVGENTSTYLFHPLVPKRIKELLPNAKLIINLRNPVNRAFSNYNHQVKQKFEIRTFDDAINSEFLRMELLEKNPDLKINNPDFDNAVIFNYIRHGIYVDKIRTWFELFPREQIQILPTNLLTNEPRKFLKITFDFLGISDYPIENLKKTNVGNYNKMNETTKKRLSDFYEPHNEGLFELIGKKLEWDN